MGINNGLRVGDPLKLKVSNAEKIKSGQTITIQEGKTGKEKILMVIKAVHKTIKNFLKEVQPESDEFLFDRQKGRGATYAPGGQLHDQKAGQESFNFSIAIKA